MQGAPWISIWFTRWLVVLSAVTGMLCGVDAAAQQSPTVFGVAPFAKSEIAESPDEAAFKKLLIENSPWKVEWFNQTFLRSGTFGMSFAVDSSGKLSGKFLGDPSRARGTPPGPLKEVVLKKDCVRVVNPSGTKYNYCLMADGALKGPYEGMTNQGTGFTGEAVATPTAR